MDFSKLQKYLDDQKQMKIAQADTAPQVDKDKYQKFLEGSNGVFQAQPSEEEKRKQYR